jgi:hypothetical protein
VITLDYKTLSSFTFFDVGAAVLFLAITFYLLKNTRVLEISEKRFDQGCKDHGAKKS